MKINILIKACFLSLIISHTPSIVSESWFSDFMVRVPVIGKYWMNNNQRQIYTYKNNLKELKKIKDNSLYPTDIAKEMTKSCTNLNEDSVELRIRDIVENIDSIDSHQKMEAHAALYNHRQITTRRSLDAENISQIDACIKQNKSKKGIREISRIMELNNEINKFRQTNLDKKSNTLNWINNNRRQVDTYKNNLKELKKIKDNSLYPTDIAKEMTKSCTNLNEDSVELRIRDIVENIDSIDSHQKMEAHAAQYNHTQITTRRSLDAENISQIDACIKQNKSKKGIREISRIMELNDEINKFRQTDLYKKSNIHKMMEPTESAIKMRENALHGIKNTQFRLGTEKESKPKEFQEKSYSPSLMYYADIFKAFNFKEKQAIEHIEQNLKKLKAERAKLQSKVATYEAIDE